MSPCYGTQAVLWRSRPCQITERCENHDASNARVHVRMMGRDGLKWDVRELEVRRISGFILRGLMPTDIFAHPVGVVLAAKIPWRRVFHAFNGEMPHHAGDVDQLGLGI